MLCGTRKKPQAGPPYLHELHGIRRTALFNKRWEAGQPDCFGEKPLQPEKKEPADDRLDAVLVERRVFLTDRVPVCRVLICEDDLMLVRKRDPVIGHKGRRQKGVRLPAFGTPDAADPKGLDTCGNKDAPPVISMNR